MIAPHGYHTHFPALAGALHIAPAGTVLEVGAGLWSTAMLHLACVGSDRDLITLESNAEWLEKFKRLQSRGDDPRPRHDLKLVDPTPDGWTLAIDAAIGQATAIAVALRQDIFTGFSNPNDLGRPTLQRPTQKPIALAFIDHAPESERRKAIEQPRPHVALFVMHDTDPEWDPAYNTQEILASFPHRWTYNVTRPQTTLFSDTITIPFDDRAALPEGEVRP